VRAVVENLDAVLPRGPFLVGGVALPALFSETERKCEVGREVTTHTLTLRFL